MLQLALPERTTAICNQKEDQWFDRKSIRIEPKKLAQTLVAFANAEGGVALVGINSGNIESVEDFPEKSSLLRRTLTAEYLQMPFPATVTECEVLDQQENVKHILVFTVSPGQNLCRTANGDVYVRKGDSSIKQTPPEVQELEYTRGSVVFEAQPCPLNLSELSSKFVNDFVKKVGATRGVEHLLKSRGLLSHDGQVTNAACLLFSNNPSESIPGSEIRVVRYQGKERLTGNRQNIIFDKRTELPIPQAIDQAIEWVEANIPHRKSLNANNRFSYIPLAPKAAWVEGIVNAAIHRSYSYTGDHIRIEIFDDRIEITNPGSFQYATERFPNPLSTTRYARNPRIARTCTDLGYSQELGEGIKRIFQEMQTYGLTDPVYEQPPMHVKLTLPFIAKISATESGNLPKHADRVLMALRKLGGAGGTTDIATTAGIANPTARKILQSLQKQGLVSWNGKSPNDPRAFWQLEGY
ncbi:ATP-binding protein [Arcanobacterium pinnipediorum]|uniref:DNA binding domain-containing protein n=1 Tax=Arcanobacterium pinnipediorum TaxID=1503041 RepID=A0ABY5AH20_9ACTO|nr:ATP-binding protein [Arcanobacterium pinnipediorum]USR79502.1 putative DNA binding domain-containing protein [Arcanobacterium pinnipediorum]